MTTINIGILAHVDAGKTSLTERLLFEAGVIGQLGSVDEGNTRTDSLAMERRRGITISSGVATFAVGDQTINLIDTPGHAEFIAEVERALGVLDGAILVVSATSGVQASTKILMRTLQRLRVPTLLFVNKIDQPGAVRPGLLEELRRRLSLMALPLLTVRNLGTPHATVHARSFDDRAVFEEVAELLAEQDESLLKSYVEGKLNPSSAWAALVNQTGKAQAHPVFFGSAVTGAGIPELVQGIVTFIPPAGSTEKAGATVFKVERGGGGERVAYARVHGGSIDSRERVNVFRRSPDGVVRRYRRRITALQLGEAAVTQATAGQIVRLGGIEDIRVGDRLGDPSDLDTARVFPAPGMVSLVTVVQAEDRARLYAALRELSDQDPLIGLKVDEHSGELSVRTYGEVQSEVIRDRLREDFGIEARFALPAPVYLEKPIGVGTALQLMEGREPTDPWATIGLRVTPAPTGTGIRYRIAVERGSLPRAFHTAIQQAVYRTAQKGPQGWEVTDCEVTLTHSGFQPPVSNAGGFRELTERLLSLAFERAGTQVYEPIELFDLEIPDHAAGAALIALAKLGAICDRSVVEQGVAQLTGAIPAVSTPEFRRQLPALGNGEGIFAVEPGGYRALRKSADAAGRNIQQ